jgi:hypothetical protein
LPSWPNNELPSPISPTQIQSKLINIKERLDRAASPIDQPIVPRN